LFSFNKIYKSPSYFEGEQKTVKIPSNSSYDDIVQIMLNDSIIKTTANFSFAAKLMKYDNRESYPTGKYLIKKGATIKDIISILRAGRQVPTDLVINNVRTLKDLCGKISTQIEPDSFALYDYFMNPENLKSWGYNKDNILSLFIPNTYEVFWNTSKEGVFKRMKKENEVFWNKREDKLKATNLTKEEVYALASIVEKESNYLPERPRIAGVYLNRINNGIPLQADPTVVFATGEYDLRRVLNKHLEFDSPYNTYKYAGLPPGPIYMPSVSSIDAVLNAEKHNYLYFCAKPGYGSEHAFATNLKGHNDNANKYRSWLSSEKIK
jgi:UPF0755 protein